MTMTFLVIIALSSYVPYMSVIVIVNVVILLLLIIYLISSYDNITFTLSDCAFGS